jgi:sulfur carrier protein ThiS
MMPTVQVAALGTARKLLGFSSSEVAVEQGTVADLLRDLRTLDGGTLYDHLVCEGKLRGDFAVMVNGLSLKSDQLGTRLQGGDQVVAMAILRHLHGG